MILLFVASICLSTESPWLPMNRRKVVSRHNVVLTKFDDSMPVQVGNGEFAFGMDITGLQTFVPFNTMSQWGWHTSALPPGKKIEDFEGQVWDTHGRPVRYPMPDPNHPEISDWLAGNPHRINLGRIGLTLKKKDGSLAVAADLENARQVLDLWNGIVTSQFKLDGVPVTVKTACHPKLDQIAANIESPLLKEGRLSVFLECPGNDPRQFANFVGDWSHPGRFEMRSFPQMNHVDMVRRIDNDAYSVSLKWDGGATLTRPSVSGQPPLKIVSAKYGARDRWLDVTEQAQKLVSDGRMTMRADNNLGPEPIHGVVKSLKVVFNTGGKDQTAEANENSDIHLDVVPNRERLTLQPTKDSTSLSFVCAFSPRNLPAALPTARSTFAECRESWPQYWQSGGFINLAGSTDPRWHELERRIVLSQYLMKVNEAGSLPPQESGLVNNGWFGRFHMEMVWWHATHWALWNHWSELNKSLGIYKELLPAALKLAKSEGYQGARWPKCIGPGGREWPHEIHSLLIWQQPHPIFFAELDYRAHPTKETLKKWQPIVEATADFLATFAYQEPKSGRYVLGPPIVLVSENTKPKTTMNPTFELGYWRFGLRTAQEWRKRMDLKTRPLWTKVLNGLSPLPKQDGLYVLHEGVKDMWTKWNFEHPALTGAYGLLPGDGVDPATMRKTFARVTSTWDFNHTWGWDFPMLAMCAARLGQPDRAIDMLLHSSPGFQFDAHGLATGGPIPYFPANGGLLYAVALMAAGWDGAPKTDAPGFPKNGKWKVKWEGLSRAL